MKNSGEKRYIPGSNPDWNLELPDEYSNSLVSKDGKVWDDGYNYDEKIDDDYIDETDQTNHNNLGEQNPSYPTHASKTRQEIIKPDKKEEPQKMMGTQEKWGYKIPENMSNSLVSADGTSIKNHWADEKGTLADWNYDEKKDPEDIEEQ